MKSANSFTAICGLLVCMTSATASRAIAQDADLLEFTSRYLKTLMESNQARMDVAGRLYQRAAENNDPDEAAKQTEIISRLNAATLTELRELSSGNELSYPLDFLTQDIELALQRRSEAGSIVAKCFHQRDNGNRFIDAVNSRTDADKWIGITGGALAAAEKVLQDGGNFGTDKLKNPTINDDSRFLDQFISLYFDGSREFEKSPLQLQIARLNERRDSYTNSLRRMGSALSTAREVLDLEEARLERLKFDFDGKLSPIAKNICYRLSEVQLQLVEVHRSMVNAIDIPYSEDDIAKSQQRLAEVQNEAEQLKLSLAVLRGILQRGGSLSR